MKRLLWTLLFLIYLDCCFSTNRALLIGIGEYLPETGWKTIHGDADVKLLSSRLKKQGFVVHRLINKQATKEGITKALKDFTEQCQAGDFVYLHFSGHGQLISDINGDEEDLWDESFIPYDAHKYYSKGIYEGENHLIDDEMNQYLIGIQKKIGKDGVIFLSVDACHSKDLERGAEEVEEEEDAEKVEDADIVNSARGSDENFVLDGSVPLALQRMACPQPLNQGGRLIVVSACLENERNYEFKSASGSMYGSLSYAIAKLLLTGYNVDDWIRYFENKLYKRDKIFQSTQHPQLVIYP